MELKLLTPKEAISILKYVKTQIGNTVNCFICNILHLTSIGYTEKETELIRFLFEIAKDYKTSLTDFDKNIIFVKDITDDIEEVPDKAWFLANDKESRYKLLNEAIEILTKELNESNSETN